MGTCEPTIALTKYLCGTWGCYIAMAGLQWEGGWTPPPPLFISMILFLSVSFELARKWVCLCGGRGGGEGGWWSGYTGAHASLESPSTCELVNCSQILNRGL